jgi:Ser/Thr protein kinase RdoA (MazF antagonist)
VAPANPLPAAYDVRLHGEGRRVTERVSRWHSETGDVAIKVFSAADRDRGVHEAELLAFLGEAPAGAPAHGFRVQTLVRTATGAAWAESHGGCVLVTRWEAGDFRSYDTYSATEWAALGSSLASLHQRLDAMTDASAETLSARLGRIDPAAERIHLATPTSDLPAHPRIDAAWIATYLATCRRMLDACHPGATGGFPADDPQRPIHNDYNQHNYLFDGILPPRIIDWEASIGAPREFEVVRCLNHLPLQVPALARSFLDGYQAVRPLQAKRMRWAVDTSCLMHATKHWVLEGWLHGHAGFDQRLLGAMEMVSMLAARRDELTAFFTDGVEGPR